VPSVEGIRVMATYCGTEPLFVILNCIEELAESAGENTNESQGKEVFAAKDDTTDIY